MDKKLIMFRVLAYTMESDFQKIHTIDAPLLCSSECDRQPDMGRHDYSVWLILT
jgi:hypothetical protein